MCMGPKDLAAVPLPHRRSSILDNSHRKDLGMIYVARKYASSRWLFQRYQAVALVLPGYPYTPVSQIIGRSLATNLS